MPALMFDGFDVEVSAPDHTRITAARRRHAAGKGAALRTGRYEDYLDMHGGHEALHAFLRIPLDRLDDARYWSLLRDSWQRHDMVHDHLRVWRNLFSADRPERAAMMNFGERQILARLPERVPIWRGASSLRGFDAAACAQGGIAWTLDEQRASWFARRGGPGFVAHTVVARKRIIAYLSGRKEREVIVLDTTGNETMLKEEN